MKRERPQKPPRKSGVSILAILLLLVFLVFPSLALARVARIFEAPWLFGYAVVISVAAYFLYRHDKRRAQTGGWRTPEATLHLVEFLGGWPGAFLAQCAFRHKTSKRSYQAAFWFIVLLHELAAFELLQGFPYTRKALELLKS